MIDILSITNMMKSDVECWDYLLKHQFNYVLTCDDEKFKKYCIEIYRSNLDYVEKNYEHTEHSRHYDYVKCYLRIAFAFSNSTELIAFLYEKSQILQEFDYVLSISL